MIEKKKFQFTAKMMSVTLISSIILLFIAAGVGSWFMQKQLSSQVAAADHAKIDAELGQTELQQSQVLEDYLAKNQASIEKVRSVVAETKTYQYQNQIVDDIQSYAARAGVRILGFTFPQETTTAKPDSSGLKSIAATVSLSSPVSYVSYLKFLKYIEQNTTKMQITSVALNPDTKDLNNIESPSVGLKVYVR